MKPLSIAHITINYIMMVLRPENPVIRSIRLCVIKSAQLLIINCFFHESP